MTDISQHMVDRYTSSLLLLIPQGAAKQTIGNLANKKCRFCNLTSPQTTFGTEAHVFPTFIGSRALVSTEECDVCNKFVAEMLEDHLDKYLGIHKTVAALKSRRGVPTYRHGEFRLSREDNEIRINTDEDGNLVQRDEANRTLTINAIRGPHIKQQAYKCFVKMALSIMPTAELPKFQQTTEWVMARNIDQRKNFFQPLNLFQIFIPGLATPRGVLAQLLRRRNGNEDVPYMIFLLGFGNWIYQTIIPCPEEDAVLAGKTTAFGFYPTPFGIAMPLDAVKSIWPMESVEVTRDERVPLQFKYETMEHRKL